MKPSDRFDSRRDIELRECIQAEAALANALQREYKSMTRTEALKNAKRMLENWQRAR